jgi:exopolysaccharide production protein ExoY
MSLQSESPLHGRIQTGVAAGGFYRRYGKRSLDLALGVPLFVVAVALIALLALLVVATSGWPPLYSARRLGRDGREFKMWKIRTMVQDADNALEEWRITHPDLAEEYAQNFKLKDDPRVTALGRFLRRSSLDELPQLLNVLRGEMSLVGPRPYMLGELAESPTTLAAVSSVRPGLTGAWQVSGRNGLGPEIRMRLDERYVQSCSLGIDLLYLARTVRPRVILNGQ